MANYIKGTKIQENSISETKLDSSLQSWKETVTNHINNNDNPHNITKSSIGLDNVTNDAQVKRSELGVANGVATLDSTGKVPSGQLPSYVDDVIEGYLYNGVFYKDTSYTTSIVGESGKIYIDLPTNKTYRWTGSVYGVISETIALGETSSTAYRGDRGKIAYDHSQSAHAPSNAQANVIETIKVNGTALTPNSKAVDITVPTVGNGTITIKQGGTSKGTFTTNQNGNTTIELTDTNTTYTAGDGLSLSGTTFSNNGVRSIATGTTNGTISVNTNGNISNIGVYGLKSAAYTDSSDYAATSHTHSQYLTGITKAMVEGVLTGNITSHTHSYLPLSGGTLSGSGAELLKLDSSNSSYNAILFKIGGVAKSEFGFTVGKCSYIYDYTSGKYLGVDVNGTPFYGALSGTGKYALLHSGNYNSYSPKLDGTGASGTWGINISGKANIANNLLYVENIPANTRGELDYKYRIYTGLWSKKDLGYATQYGQYIDLSGGSTWYHRLAFNTTGVIEHFQGINTTTLTKVGDLAYTSSNVASATKLANSRTIWGQSFDGTGDVSGMISNAGDIIPATTHVSNLGSSSRVWERLYVRYIDTDSEYYLRLCAGGTEIVTITDSSGGSNVGIGTTSPSYKLHVVGDGYFTENVITESDFSSRGNAIIDGRVGIGTSSPAYNLDVDGNMRITGPIRLNVPNSNEKYYISTEYNGLLGITYEGRYQNPAFLMNNLGYVYLNCENPLSPAYPLVVNGTIECTKLLQTSDIKYKTNIKQIEYEEALKIIENLNPVTWDWNENTVETGSSSGFVAQEAEEFIPNAISRDNENNLSLDYTQLHSYEIKVIQEQQKEIKDLKQRLEVLENLVLQLTNREI